MYKKIFMVTALFFVLTPRGTAQELQGKITVISSRIATQIDRKIFNTMQASLNNFIFNRKWTKDTYQPQERIKCNFLLNLDEAKDQNVFRATLTIQAARPVYNSNYETPLINFNDPNVVFRYVEFQQLDFNENRISGTDGVAANLTAILAFYVYTILGLDGDAYSLKGGDANFQKAMNIVNNAPEGRDISGWRAFDGLRNRFWLMENLTSNKYAQIHDALYNYYRLALDNYYSNELQAQNAAMEALTLLNNINTNAPNSMIIQFFFQGRAAELIGIFKKAAPDMKVRATEILQKLDVANAANYKKEL
jgi:Domain of unknown function (DUF4835)